MDKYYHLILQLGKQTQMTPLMKQMKYFFLKSEMYHKTIELLLWWSEMRKLNEFIIIAPAWCQLPKSGWDVC